MTHLSSGGLEAELPPSNLEGPGFDSQPRRRTFKVLLGWLSLVIYHSVNSLEWDEELG
jgi:hypothetical protein